MRAVIVTAHVRNRIQRITDLFISEGCGFIILLLLYLHRRFKELILNSAQCWQPISVAPLLKAWVCGRSLKGITVSNPAGGMNVCCECCVLSGRDHRDGPITCREKPYRVWCASPGATITLCAHDDQVEKRSEEEEEEEERKKESKKEFWELRGIHKKTLFEHKLTRVTYKDSTHSAQ